MLLSKLLEFTAEKIETAVRDLQTKNNWHKRQYFMMLRLAITGEKATPPLFETASVIGKKSVIERLESTQKLIMIH